MMNIEERKNIIYNNYLWNNSSAKQFSKKIVRTIQALLKKLTSSYIIIFIR